MVIFFFILGASVGSFLNVLIFRLPREKSIRGRSYCDHCLHQLAWYDLIPIASFIFLRGRCRYCYKRISWQYPLVETITGASFVLISNFKFQISNFPISNLYYLFAYLGIIACLIVIFFSDAKYHIIDDRLQIGLFIFSVILLPSYGQLLWTFVNRVGAALLVVLPIYFLHWATRGRGMGFGDVKLSFTIGFLLGVKAGFLALYFAFVTGGIIGLLLILLGRKKLKSKIAFGPFLVIGILVMLFFGDKVWQLISKIYGIY